MGAGTCARHRDAADAPTAGSPAASRRGARARRRAAGGRPPRRGARRGRTAAAPARPAASTRPRRRAATVRRARGDGAPPRRSARCRSSARSPTRPIGPARPDPPWPAAPVPSRGAGTAVPRSVAAWRIAAARTFVAAWRPCPGRDRRRRGRLPRAALGNGRRHAPGTGHRPVAMTITADPAATAPDAAAASCRPRPLDVTWTRRSTFTDDRQAGGGDAARGVVRFRNYDFTSSQHDPQGQHRQHPGRHPLPTRRRRSPCRRRSSWGSTIFALDRDRQDHRRRARPRTATWSRTRSSSSRGARTR